MEFIKDIAKGIFIGAGAILPGISSGVLCVIFGIYDKLVESVLGIYKDFKNNFRFLFPIIIGTFLGVILFGNILKIVLTNFPMQTKYAFIGLILGSIPVLLKKINSKNGFRLHYLIYTVGAFLIGFLMVIMEENIAKNILLNVNLTDTYNYFSIEKVIFLIVVGICMSVGIVVPGVSSTIILMCFGVYNIYISAIANLNIYILVPLGIGVVIGGIIFLNIINYLLKKFYMQTFYSIIGFTLGSVLVLYIPLSFNVTGIISIILLIIGFYTASFFESKQ